MLRISVSRVTRQSGAGWIKELLLFLTGEDGPVAIAGALPREHE